MSTPTIAPSLLRSAWWLFVDGMLEANAALSTHRLRTWLSIAGGVLGVASILVSVAIVEGGRREAIAAVARLGERNVIVRSGDAAFLHLDDLDLLRRQIRGIAAAAATRTSSQELLANHRHLTAAVVGVTAEWRQAADVSVARGRWLTPADVQAHRRVLVLGGQLAVNLFGNGSAVDEHIRIAGEWFRVVGIIQPRTSAGPAGAALQGFDIDQAAFAPFTAAGWSNGPHSSADAVQELVVQLDRAELVGDAAERIRSILASNRPLATADRLDIVAPREIIRARLAARRSFDLMLIGVAAVSLVISAVAVMNITLVSVSERTQEIGVRRACGARRIDIRRQFTMEVLLLTVAGACGGLLVAAAVVAALAAAGWPTAINAWSAALALALVLATGVSCGIYPACRAARLSPATALRAP